MLEKFGYEFIYDSLLTTEECAKKREERAEREKRMLEIKEGIVMTGDDTQEGEGK
jgi:hypothetical protein